MASAVSIDVGARPKSEASFCSAASSLRARLRTERGAQSAARTASRIAPRMRCAANRSKGTPLDSSNRPAASTKPRAPAVASSSRSTWRGKLTAT